MVTHYFVTIGQIKKSFGVKGEVLARLRVGTSFDELVGVMVWTVPPDLSWRGGRITRIQPHGSEFRLSFEGLTSVEFAKPLAGKSLVASTEDIRDGLIEDSGHDEAPVGYRATDQRYGDLGTVVDAIVTGANDVWVVRGRYGEVLLPVIDEVVRSIDHESKSLDVALLPGLIEGDPL